MSGLPSSPPTLRPPPDPFGPDAWRVDEDVARARSRTTAALFVNVFLVASCGLVYELLAGAVASYLLGDSVTQFSLVIGLYLSAMGVGAWLSRFVEHELARRFIEVELTVALVGGLSAPAMFFAFGNTAAFRPLLFLDVFAIGVLVGLELPLLMRILEHEMQFKELVSRVLAFDYLGALFASILFPVVFVPYLGLVRTALVMGMVNAAVGVWGASLLRGHLGERRVGLQARGIVVLLVLSALVIKADSILGLAEERAHGEPVAYAKSTPYQRLVVTQGTQGFSLYINGNLQFASADEYRYHEALVHPAMLAVEKPRRVLVLGGGDGLAVREILKHDDVDHVTLVDLDPGMTALSKDVPALASLNEHAFDDSRVLVENADAFVWVLEREAEAPRFDVVIVDFPDPNHLSLGKLYTRGFYQGLMNVLVADGALAVQATSPLFVRASYWTIVTTIEAAGFIAAPYHATVPSFGVWGFVLAKKKPFRPTLSLSSSPTLSSRLRFLTDDVLQTSFSFPADMARVPAQVNRLDNQLLVRLYETEASRAPR
jgi:spermidine synthase